MRSKCPDLPSRGPEVQTETVFVQMAGGKKAEDDYHPQAGSESIRPHYVPQFGVHVQVYPVGMDHGIRISVIASHLSTVMSYPLSCCIVPRDHVYFVIFYSSTVDSVITHRCPWTHWQFPVGYYRVWFERAYL